MAPPQKKILLNIRFAESAQRIWMHERKELTSNVKKVMEVILLKERVE